jgi:hypothetical protein
MYYPKTWTPEFNVIVGTIVRLSGDIAKFSVLVKSVTFWKLTSDEFPSLAI